MSDFPRASAFNDVTRYPYYNEGKTAVLQALVGQVMKKTSGKGNPVSIQEILTELLH